MAQYRSPRPTGTELFMTETLPQITALLTDYRKWEKQAEIDTAKQASLEEHRKATIEQSEKDRFVDILKIFDKPEERLSFLKGYQGSSVSEDMNVDPLISATERTVQTNNRGDIFLNDFRFGKVNDLAAAWGSYYGMDPNNSEHMKSWKQAESIYNRERDETKNKYTKITSLANAILAFKDSEGRLDTEGQEYMKKLKEQLLELGRTGGPIEPVIIGGRKVVLPKNVEQMSSDEIMDAFAGQIRNAEMEESYTEFLSGLGMPADGPEYGPQEEPYSPPEGPNPLSLRTAPLELDFSPQLPPADPYTGGIPTRPDVGIPPDEPDIAPDAPLTDILLQEFTPWTAPPLPEVPSMNIIKSGISSSVVEVNGIQKEITPTELSVLQKSGKRWNLLPEKRKESIASKLAKKFNTTKEVIQTMAPAITDAPEPPKIDNFIMVKEGISKSMIKLNNIQANVSPSELAVLRGQDRLGLNAKTRGRLIKHLAKKFNVTEDDIKKLPFEKYKRK